MKIKLILVCIIIFAILASGCTEKEEVCCKVTPVVLEPEPKYEWRENSECPPAGDIVGANFEIVDNKYCE